MVKKEGKGRSDGLESRTKRRRKREDGDEDENVKGSRKEKRTKHEKVVALWLLSRFSYIIKEGRHRQCHHSKM